MNRRPTADSRACSRRIVIAGLGLVTPLGHSAWRTFRALLDGRTLGDRAASLPDQADPLAVVRSIGCCALTPHSATDPAVDLAEHAARAALADAGLLAVEPAAWLGVSKGAMTAWRQTVATVRPGHPHPDPLPGRERGQDALVMALGPAGWMGAELSRRLGCTLPRTVVAACASSLTALDAARRHLLRGPVGASALVVSAEASLLPLFIHSYQRLGVLPPLNPAQYRARPLDERRCGFVLSEQGAAVVLRVADGELVHGEIELLDTAVGAEGHHLILPAPDMPALRHLAERLMADREIDLLHPHATGTAENDAAELDALLPSVSESTDIYACKGALGHGLGAAGLTALVIAVLCAHTGRRPPMPWLDQPIACRHRLTAEGPTSRHLRTQAIFAAGFGGHVAGAVIGCHG